MLNEEQIMGKPIVSDISGSDTTGRVRVIREGGLLRRMAETKRLGFLEEHWAQRKD